MIQGERIYLRPFIQHDDQRLLQYELKNRLFFKPYVFTRNDQYYTLANIRKYIHAYETQWQNKESYRYGIFLNSSHQLIGTIALNDILWPLRCAYIGYALDEDHNKKGYMSEALKLMIHHAFFTLKLHRIEAGVMPSNVPSWQLLEKHGFEREGLMRKNVHINGQWEDHYHYALINPNDL
jgi:ribosomal-protein-alanine N-acetyltransferase